MSGAQSWSVKGIDPKVREAAREAASRQGMTLGEYLSLALANQPAPPPQQNSNPSAATARLRSSRLSHQHLGQSQYEEEEDDWHISPQTHQPRVTDPVRLAQRIESIERRTQLAVTGLDRAVSTIDRTVLGLAARIDDAETVSSESADRISEALDQFRLAGETLGGRLEQAEHEVRESREALLIANSDLSDTTERLTTQFSTAQNELSSARERLEAQVATAEEVGRRAEAAASFLATELENREAALGHKLGSLEDRTRSALSDSLSEARAAAEDAARHAAEASADAVLELRALHDRLADRVEESELSTRRAIQHAVEETRNGQQTLIERVAGAEFEARGVRDSLVEEVVRLESEIGARIAAADQLKTEQAILIARIEKAEAGSRESTAGLRQAAGAAIADLRNAQLGLAARLKQVEEVSSRTGALDLADVRSQQAEIAERLATLEETARASPMEAALANFERRLDDIALRVEKAPADDAVKTLDQALQRLAERLAETESTANNAIRTLEETVSSLGARVETGGGAAIETEAVRAMLEHRLDEMAQSVTQMVGQAQTELAGQVQAALGGEGEGFEGALADVNRRLAGAERRQAQTIEAISIEIKRMSETVDKRLRSVENRNDDAAGAAVREELSRMQTTLEARFDEIERREAAAFDRMGLEVGRLSERLEERVGAVEGRSAQAIEHVGEQVARMAERFNQRHELLARDLGERMIDSEERAGARVADAIGSIMQRLSEVEEHSAEAVAPVQKAMSSMASRLEALGAHDDIPTPSRRYQDYEPDAPLGAPLSSSPMDAAKPLRAGPLQTPADPHPPALVEPDSDIYFAEDIEDAAAKPHALDRHDEHVTDLVTEIDDLVIDDPFLDDADAFAPPPPNDDDPFWIPAAAAAAGSSATVQSEPMTLAEEAMFTEAPPPPGKNDYLNAARRAAQAQQIPAKGRAAKDASEAKPAKEMSLRGSSRVVFWGAASAITLLLAGGAWYWTQQQENAAPTAPAPEAAPPVAATPPAADVYDPNAPFGAPVDPFATAPTTGEASPEGPVVSSTTPNTATAQATPRAVVAGPLAPRNVSLEQAAQSGDAVAQYELGLQRIAAGRNTDGAALLRRAADRGLAMAQYRLGKLYERGEGVTADLTLARQWTERAAAAGNRRAMHDLGVYFARGEGAPLDEAAAFRWFRQAAELGVADSQYNLGVLYQQGRGVGVAAPEAMFWFLVAARQGDEDAAARATTLEGTLQPVQVEQARARAQAFRPRAASAQANGEFGPRPWSTPARPAA